MTHRTRSMLRAAIATANTIARRRPPIEVLLTLAVIVAANVAVGVAAVRGDGTADKPSVMVVNTDGSGLRPLTEAPALGPAWSPDGRKVAVSAAGVEKQARDDAPSAASEEEPPAVAETGWDLCVLNADGSGLTLVASTPLDDLSATWSPDGMMIAFLPVAPSSD